MRVKGLTNGQIYCIFISDMLSSVRLSKPANKVIIFSLRSGQFSVMFAISNGDFSKTDFPAVCIKIDDIIIVDSTPAILCVRNRLN